MQDYIRGIYDEVYIKRLVLYSINLIENFNYDYYYYVKDFPQSNLTSKITFLFYYHLSRFVNNHNYNFTVSWCDVKPNDTKYHINKANNDLRILNEISIDVGEILYVLTSRHLSSRLSTSEIDGYFKTKEDKLGYGCKYINSVAILEILEYSILVDDFIDKDDYRKYEIEDKSEETLSMSLNMINEEYKRLPKFISGLYENIFNKIEFKEYEDEYEVHDYNKTYYYLGSPEINDGSENGSESNEKQVSIHELEPEFNGKQVSIHELEPEFESLNISDDMSDEQINIFNCMRLGIDPYSGDVINNNIVNANDDYRLDSNSDSIVNNNNDNRANINSDDIAKSNNDDTIYINNDYRDNFNNNDIANNFENDFDNDNEDNFFDEHDYELYYSHEFNLMDD